MVPDGIRDSVKERTDEDRFKGEVENAVRQLELIGLYETFPDDWEPSKKDLFRSMRRVCRHRKTDTLRDSLLQSQVGCCTSIVELIDGIELLGEALAFLVEEHSTPEEMLIIGNDRLRPWELLAVFTAFTTVPLSRSIDALEAVSREIPLAGFLLSLCYLIEDEFKRTGVARFADNVAATFHIRGFDPLLRLIRKAFSDGTTTDRLLAVRTWSDADEQAEVLRMVAIWLLSMDDSVKAIAGYLYEELVELFQIEVPDESSTPVVADVADVLDARVLAYLMNHDANSKRHGLRIRVLNEATGSNESVAGAFKTRMMKLKKSGLVDSETDRARANRWWITDFGVRSIEAYLAGNEER